MKRLGIATRFYGHSPADRKRLETWVEAARTVVQSEHILIAVNVAEDASKSLAFLQREYPAIDAFPVYPWGRVVQAPNALLLKAAELKLDQLLFVSTEYPVTRAMVQRLRAQCDPSTLVVGASLESHEFMAKPNAMIEVARANGLQIPWNTYALWSVPHLIHTGFVLTADSARDPDNAGMEEMGTIAAQQLLWPGNAHAKLILPARGEIIFNEHGWTVYRRKRHERIMRSKKHRSNRQLARLSVQAPTVQHIAELTATHSSVSFRSNREL